jgi:hypothetical protein
VATDSGVLLAQGMDQQEEEALLLPLAGWQRALEMLAWATTFALDCVTSAKELSRSLWHAESRSRGQQGTRCIEVTGVLSATAAFISYSVDELSSLDAAVYHKHACWTTTVTPQEEVMAWSVNIHVVRAV